MRRSFTAPASLDPLPPSCFPDALLHCIHPHSMLHCFNYLRILCCACLCKCVNECALLVLEWRRALFCGSQEPTHPAIPSHPSLVSRPLVTLHINLFHSFLHFPLVSVSSFDMLLIVRRNTKQTNKLHMKLYYVLDTTFVPFGEEPVTLSNAMPYAEASNHLAYLKSLQDGGVYEMIEA